MAGCSTVPPAAHQAPKSADIHQTRPVPAEPPLSPEEADARAEGHALYSAAMLHEWNEEWELARESYFKAGQADPENESLVLEVSQRLLQLKDAQKAIGVLTNATERSGATAPVLAQVARIQFMLGKKDLAIDANKAALKKNPRLISAYRNLAQIYLQERQYPEALKYLDQAARQSNVDAMYFLELGELYTAFISTGPAETVKSRALDCFTRAANLKLTNIFHIQALGNAFALLGETDKAIEIYQELLKERPPLPGLRERLAELYIRKQDREHAAEQLTYILRDSPTHVQANFLMGSLAIDAKKYGDAVNYFQKTLLLNPDFEPVYYDLAAAQLSQREATKALTTLNAARTRFKETFVGEFYTALAFTQAKDYTNAVKHLTTAEVVARAKNETNRLNHIYYFQLGAACERTGQNTEAENYMRKCLSISPDFSDALNYLGYMWAERGTNLTQARQMIEKALKAEPKNAAFLDSLGWVFYKLGKNQDALKYILQAVENSKEEDATLYDHLGDIYSALNQKDKARDAWQKALAVEPSDAIRKKLGPETQSRVPEK